MEIFFGWLIFSVVSGAIASAKGRSGIGYFLLSIVLSPIVGLILAAALPRIEQAPNPTGDGPGRIKCPDCAELILAEAKVCKHCGFRLDAPAPVAAEPIAESTEELMAKLGIGRDGDAFTYGGFRYDKLADALAYARKQLRTG